MMRDGQNRRSRDQGGQRVFRDAPIAFRQNPVLLVYPHDHLSLKGSSSA